MFLYPNRRFTWSDTKPSMYLVEVRWCITSPHPSSSKYIQELYHKPYLIGMQLRLSIVKGLISCMGTQCVWPPLQRFSSHIISLYNVTLEFFLPLTEKAVNYLQVLRTPKVAVASTGDELVDPKQGFTLGKGQVRFVSLFNIIHGNNLNIFA